MIGWLSWLIERLIDLMNHWYNDQLISWLVECLIRSFIDWLIKSCIILWLTEKSLHRYQMSDWWFIGWLINWLIDCLMDWLIDGFDWSIHSAGDVTTPPPLGPPPFILVLTFLMNKVTIKLYERILQHFHNTLEYYGYM